MKQTRRVAHLISGSGTTMESVIKACQSGEIDAVTPVVVINPSQFTREERLIPTADYDILNQAKLLVINLATRRKI